MEKLNELVKKELLRTGLWVAIAAVISIGLSYLW